MKKNVDEHYNMNALVEKRKILTILTSAIKNSDRKPLTAEKIMSPLESVSASTSVSQVMRKMHDLGVPIDNGKA